MLKKATRLVAFFFNDIWLHQMESIVIDGPQVIDVPVITAACIHLTTPGQEMPGTSIRPSRNFSG